MVRKAKNYLNNGFVSDLTSNDLRCNQLAAGTNTLTVAAGAKVTVTANNDFYHPGPFRMFLQICCTRFEILDLLEARHWRGVCLLNGR